MDSRTDSDIQSISGYIGYGSSMIIQWYHLDNKLYQVDSYYNYISDIIHNYPVLSWTR